jgi:hypothetical protein
MRYALGCRLGYRVTEPTSFVFNVEVARIPQQRVLHERLVVTPEVPLDTYVMPESGNRYVRLLAQPGPILLSYEAEVDLLVHRADPATVGETPLPELAFEVLPHPIPAATASRTGWSGRRRAISARPNAAMRASPPCATGSTSGSTTAAAPATRTPRPATR